VHPRLNIRAVEPYSQLPNATAPRGMGAVFAASAVRSRGPTPVSTSISFSWTRPGVGPQPGSVHVGVGTTPTRPPSQPQKRPRPKFQSLSVITPRCDSLQGQRLRLRWPAQFPRLVFANSSPSQGRSLVVRVLEDG
jgi:hypothetical protein